uniref:Ig-like domain-containing protein n=1 Tax=Pygocentrus nattereri TaxID=42514 RepID=A0AAR2JPC1_PYGNA
MSKPRPMFNRTVKLPLMLIRCVAVMASAMVLLLWFIGVLSVSLSSQAGLTVEAESGDDVTLWCKHSLTKSDYLFWCKHTNNSVPVYIACKYYAQSSSSSKSCFFMTESNRSVMRVNSTFSSLTITAVTPSDSGLYYCSSLEEKYMIFSTTTHLLVRERNQTSSKTEDKSKGGYSSDVFFRLFLVFGAVIVVLLSALLFLLCIILKYREHRKEDSDPKLKQEKEEQDGETVNYAALHFNKKSTRSPRRVETEETHVVYSSVGQ